MVSLTAKSEKRRAIRARKAGRRNTARRLKIGTPRFPVHPDGYDPTAADAKPQVQPSQPQSKPSSK